MPSPINCLPELCSTQISEYILMKSRSPMFNSTDDSCSNCSFSPIGTLDVACPRCGHKLALGPSLPLPEGPMPINLFSGFGVHNLEYTSSGLRPEGAQDMSYIWKKPPNVDAPFDSELFGLRRYATMWTCCQCDNTLMGAASNPQCHECDHERCPSCDIFHT